MSHPIMKCSVSDPYVRWVVLLNFEDIWNGGEESSHFGGEFYRCIWSNSNIDYQDSIRDFLRLFQFRYPRVFIMKYEAFVALVSPHFIT